MYVCMYIYIKVDLQELEWIGMDWIDLAQDRGRLWALVNAVMNFRVPYNAGNLISLSGFHYI